MEKNIFGEELRALFREIFKLEVKTVASDVAFLGKMKNTKLNEERLTLKERKWLENIGILTPDSKNMVSYDDRTIFSHIISAVYAGLYGLNFVDVTAHCLETIKKQKGLSEKQNLVDHLSAKEIRQFSVALYTLSNEIRQLKNAGKLEYATMSNFYSVADRAFVAGLNARRNSVFDKNSEFVTKNSKHKASNTLNNIDASLQIGTFSHKHMQLAVQDEEYCKKQKEQYLANQNQIRSLLEENDYNSNQINQVLATIDEGYYKTRCFRPSKLMISNLISRDDAMLSVDDLDAQNTKLIFAKLSLEKYLKRTDKNTRLLSDLLNCAFRSGSRAREDCIFKHQTSPEFFASFASALILDKEKKLNKNL